MFTFDPENVVDVEGIMPEEYERFAEEQTRTHDMPEDWGIVEVDTGEYRIVENEIPMDDDIEEYEVVREEDDGRGIEEPDAPVKSKKKRRIRKRWLTIDSRPV